MVDNRTTFMCRLTFNLGATTSWNPQDLSRPVMGLLYLYVWTQIISIQGDSFTEENMTCIDVVNHKTVFCVTKMQLGGIIYNECRFSSQNVCNVKFFFLCVFDRAF